MKNRAEIKREAKAILREGRVSPLLIGATLLVVTFVLGRVQDLVNYGNPFYSYAALYAEAVGNLKGDAAYWEIIQGIPQSNFYGTAFGGFFGILTGLFLNVLHGGFYLYCMGIRRGERMEWFTLLDGLGYAGRLIWCSILITCKVFLWSMLFVIPGIVAIYRYRFAYYNVLTDSRLSASGAIALSCQQTKGMKMDLFVLDLSFFGWGLLSSLTLGLLDIWLLPYMTVCDLAYFEEGQRRVGRGMYGNEQTPPTWEL